MNKQIISYQNIENFNFDDYNKFCNYKFKNYYTALKHYIKYKTINDFRLINNVEISKRYIHWQCNNISDLFKKYDENNNQEIVNVYCFDMNIFKKKINNLDLYLGIRLDIKYFINDIIIEKNKINVGVIVKYLSTINKKKSDLNPYHNIYIFKIISTNNYKKNIFVYTSPNSLNNIVQLKLNDFKKYYNSNLFIPLENSKPEYDIYCFFNQIISKKLNIGIIVKYFNSSVIKNIRELKNNYNIFIFKVSTIVNLELIDVFKENIFIYRSPNHLNNICDIEINNFKKYYDINFFINFENLKLNFKHLQLYGLIKVF